MFVSSTLFWVVTSRGLVVTYQSFAGSSCLHLEVDEASTPICENARHDIKGECNFIMVPFLKFLETQVLYPHMTTGVT
jgi:hypothetical protein